MRSSLKFSVSVLAFGMAVLFTGLASAQGHAHGGAGAASHGVPASVTSFGFGGHVGYHGVPASVTSQNFGGHAGVHGVPGSVTSQNFGAGFRVHERPLGRRRGVIYTPFYGGAYYAYPYPYPYDASGDDYSQQDDAASYQGQDTRGADARQQLADDDYRAGMNSGRDEQPEATAAEPVSDQPDTVLIFKDGRQLEVANYAIVGSTLYELNDGRSIKVQLADLDLRATVKENDNRGVEFQLPSGTTLN